MKKIGDYTARGTVNEEDTFAGNPQKITLFDGRFDTAYRVIEFKIWGSDFGGPSNADCIGKLSKNAIGSVSQVNFMRADDDNQIAWATSGAIGADAGGDNFGESIIDRDNLVVEDLYVYVRTANTTASDPINYLVVLEKYEIPESQGALLMARDRADGE